MRRTSLTTLLDTVAGMLSVMLALTASNALAQTAADVKTRNPPPPDRFVYRSLQGVEFEVTRGRTLDDPYAAAARWLRADGPSSTPSPGLRTPGPGRSGPGRSTRKSLQSYGPDRARVTHAGGDLVTTTDYTFDGEDVTISARVENHHPEEPINVAGFSGLTFDFDRPPEGLMQVQHISYFQAHGLGLCHPSFWSKIGGSYAIDGTVGVGASPWQTGWTRTLILWDYCELGAQRTGETRQSGG